MKGYIKTIVSSSISAENAKAKFVSKQILLYEGRNATYNAHCTNHQYSSIALLSDSGSPNTCHCLLYILILSWKVPWIVKTDDDTVNDMWQLQHTLKDMEKHDVERYICPFICWCSWNICGNFNTLFSIDGKAGCWCSVLMINWSMTQCSEWNVWQLQQNVDSDALMAIYMYTQGWNWLLSQDWLCHSATGRPWLWEMGKNAWY